MEYLHIDFNELESNIYRFNESEEYERIIVRNGRVGSIVLFDPNVVIKSNKSLLVQDSVELSLLGSSEGGPILIGGVQIDGSIEKLEINYLSVINGNIGLHMSQHNGNERYGKVMINDCLFIGHEREGIYIGKSDSNSDAPMVMSVMIQNTECLNNGWDGAQVSRSHFTSMTNCNFISNGQSNEPWQDFDLTINPKCQDVRLTNVKYESAQFLQAGKIFIRP